LALINTWRPDCTYGERYLCGVGTAFKLAQALYRAAGIEQDVWELLDLVAIGTVGDVVPLLGENHTLVRAGMQQLNQTRNPGLQALFQTARLQSGKIRERDISFVLAPRINAAGRMKDAGLAFRLLTTDNDAEARALAEELEQLNLSRQQQTEDLMKLVREQAQLQADRGSTALLQALTQQALSTTSARFASLQQLIAAIPRATDQKASLDLQARISAEQTMLQNDEIKLGVLYQLARADDQAIDQRAREQAITDIGSFRNLPPLQF